MLGTMLQRVFRARRGAQLEVTQVIQAPPEGVRMIAVRPKGVEVVEARLARTDGAIQSPRGALTFRAGQHYIVRYDESGEAPVRKDVFERTYKRRWDGRYKKRTDIVLHYFTLSRAVVVETQEGRRLAEAGDWIVEGVLGELYPMSAEIGEQKYERL